MSNKLIVIVGPTASGKSAFAMEIARQYDGEIICADSRTIYKYMDIGTAKPSKTDQEEIPHHLIDLVEPDQAFSAAQFKELAEAAIVDIQSRGKLAILVGGTGLYVDAVIFNYQFGPVANPAYRAILEKKSIEELQIICREKNITLPVNIQNRRHLIRTIELGGLKSQPKILRPNTMVVGLSLPKEVLLAHIIKRAEQMIEKGVLREVGQLGKKYGWESEAMSGSAYRVLGPVVKKTISLQQGLEQLVQSDTRLAKRQTTWFKRNPFIIWATNPSELRQKIEQFLKRT